MLDPWIFQAADFYYRFRGMIMTKLITDFYRGETEYSDGDIEAELLSIATELDSFDDLLEKDSRWPVIYHLSHLRQNILNWYPFKKDAEVLEVGAGCGAITSLLCERAAHVTSVELTLRRAQINYQRNRSCDNLDIYAGDIFKVDFDRKFDYVTSIGVLEYAAFMSKEKDPYSAFLKRLAGFLKPDGHLLVAIENRFGLKYFAGAREDHTARFFDGVNGYSSGARVRTFTKGELERLLDSNSFSSHRFYYPLPDYKFPDSVYTDESIGGFDGFMDLGVHDNQRYELFDELSVMRGLSGEGVLDRFSNSFFIDAAFAGTQLDTSVLEAKLSAARKPQYRIATLIKAGEKEKTVEKVPLNPACKRHLERMAENYEKYGSLHGIPLVNCRLAPDGRAVFDFARGELFSSVIERAYDGSGVESIWPLIDSYREKLLGGAKKCDGLYSERFCSFFGNERCGDGLLCVDPADIDLTFDNLTVDEGGKMTAVDYEWIMDFPVPVDYIFWRAVRYSDFFKSHGELASEIMRHYGVTEEMCETFYGWEVAFSTEKIGGRSPAVIPGTELDLNLIDPKEMIEQTVSTASFDTGAGFEPETAVTAVGRMGEPCTFAVPLPEGVRAVRFDPAEGFPCRCRILSAAADKGPVAVRPLNSVASDPECDMFLTLDPVYGVNGDFSKAKTLSITFEVDKLDPSEADVALSRTFAHQRDLETENLELRRSLDKLVNSKSWKLTAPIRRCRKMMGGD